MKDVCIIIPYRDRQEHLAKLAPQINSILSEESLAYEVLVVEQTQGKVFNRGMIKNIGFDYAKGKFRNYVFHDVDMIPISGKCSYFPVENPTHYASIVEQFGWNLAYPNFAGGVIAFDEASFQKINGYSNIYVGWGGEDDDLYRRCVKENLTVMRRQNMYSSLNHDRKIVQTDYLGNLELLQKCEERIHEDGLNSLNYKILEEENAELYRRILVEI